MDNSSGLDACRAAYAEIVDHMAHRGASFLIGTYARTTQYRHAEDIKLSPSGDLYVRRGKHWDCIGQSGRLLVAVRLLGLS